MGRFSYGGAGGSRTHLNGFAIARRTAGARCTTGVSQAHGAHEARGARGVGQEVTHAGRLHATPGVSGPAYRAIVASR